MIDPQGRLILGATGHLSELVDIPIGTTHVAFSPLEFEESFALLVHTPPRFPAWCEFREELDGSVQAYFNVSLTSYRDGDLIAELDGVQSHMGFMGSYWFECRLMVVPTPIKGATPSPLKWLKVRHYRYRNDDISIPARILWTPVTLLGDIIISPFELLTIPVWW